MPKKFIFIVQGEGRGHMTQAISLYKLITSHGHEVSKVFVGSSRRRDIPAFFYESIQADIELIASPNFVLDKDNKSIRIGPTFYQNIYKGGKYLKSVRRITNVIKATQPYAVINFYDLLGGLAAILQGGKFRFFSVAHQYLASHTDFPFPKNKRSHKKLFLLHNKLTQLRNRKVFAMSFQPYSGFSGSRYIVSPPLLRPEVKGIKTLNGNRYLAYVVNDGYADEILNWFRNQTAVKFMDCFWDKKGLPNPFEPLPGILFHQLDDKLFLDKMAACAGYISTAGFESICEAIYLNKPVLAVPVEKQYEQECNALDAVKTEKVISSTTFDVTKLLAFQKHYDLGNTSCKSWMDEMDTFYKKHLGL